MSNITLDISGEHFVAIWKLKPTDVNARAWEASTYRGEVIIRAKSEIEARQIAARAFAIASGVRMSEKITDLPWNQSSLVLAIETQDDSYQSDGSSEIIGPPEALRNADS